MTVRSFPAFAFANDDYGVSEVKVNYSKLQSFIDPYPGGVQYLRGQAMFTFEEAANPSTSSRDRTARSCLYMRLLPMSGIHGKSTRSTLP
jgi:hypothetical protein